MGGILESLTFKKYGMKIKLNQITALIGPASSGKTTVFKLLSNKVNNESVYLDRKRLNDYKIDFLDWTNHTNGNVLCIILLSIVFLLTIYIIFLLLVIHLDTITCKICNLDLDVPDLANVHLLHI